MLKIIEIRESVPSFHCSSHSSVCLVCRTTAVLCLMRSVGSLEPCWSIWTPGHWMQTAGNITYTWGVCCYYRGEARRHCNTFRLHWAFNPVIQQSGLTNHIHNILEKYSLMMTAMHYGSVSQPQSSGPPEYQFNTQWDIYNIHRTESEKHHIKGLSDPQCIIACTLISWVPFGV